jgi:Transposase DDE domain
VIEKNRNKIADELVPFENYLIVDSMTLEVCKLSRVARSKLGQRFLVIIMKRLRTKAIVHPKSYIFYGYKLHAVSTFKGVFKSFEITKASVHDIHFLKNLKT